MKMYSNIKYPTKNTLNKHHPLTTKDANNYFINVLSQIYNWEINKPLITVIATKARENIIVKS
jgi:hypothetical protein